MNFDGVGSIYTDAEVLKELFLGTFLLILSLLIKCPVAEGFPPHF